MARTRPSNNNNAINLGISPANALLTVLLIASLPGPTIGVTSSIFSPRIVLPSKRPWLSLATSYTFGRPNGEDYLVRKKYHSFFRRSSFRSPCLKLRGGAEPEHQTIPTDETAETPIAPDASAVSTNIPPGDTNENGKEKDAVEHINNNEMVYATIGMLSLIPKKYEKHNGSSDLDNKILLCYRHHGNSSCQIDSWGIKKTIIKGNDVAALNEENSSWNKEDVEYLAMAEVMGCLCHSIVLNLPEHILDESQLENQHLDDVLFCLVEGVMRRLKSIERPAQNEITIPIVVSFGGKTVNESDEANNITKVKEYLQLFLERALLCARDRHFGDESKKTGADNNKTAATNYKVLVSFSHRSASEAATEMAEEDIGQGGSIGKETLVENLVPRSIFGILATQINNDISTRWSSLHNVDAETPVVWEKLHKSECTKANEQDENGSENEIESADEAASIDATTNTISLSPSQLVSEMIQRLMAREFVNAEESLLEMESKMDSAFLNGSEDEAPMPEFGNDADAILSAMSASFYSLMDEFGSLTDEDREWVEAQRKETLMQFAGTGLLRLFHLHLQSLRDHFGRWYENSIDSLMANDFGEASEEGNDGILDQKAWESGRRDAARRAEEGFVLAAFGSIPQICRHPEGELCEEMAGMYGCTEALRGLLEDLLEATSKRGLEEEEWKDIMGVSADDDPMPPGSDVNVHTSSNPRIGLRQLIKNIKNKRQKRGPAKWYERLAGKALVIGVNYIQGWLVLQALRREARRRDLSMPKFPLF